MRGGGGDGDGETDTGALHITFTSREPPLPCRGNIHLRVNFMRKFHTTKQLRKLRLGNM
jgi:hypothetical protein